MRNAAFERIGPDSQKLWKQMLRLILASYAVDVAVLCLFVYSGSLASWVPLAYGLAGAICCASFYTLIGSGFSERFADSNLTLCQMAVAVAVQLIFIVVAPEAAHYFIQVLFLVFAFGCLRMRERDAAIAWALLAVAFLAAVSISPEIADWRLSTALQRLSDAVGTLLVLGRCTWLGVFGNRMRHLMRNRRDQLRATLSDIEIRNSKVATALHEDLGQQLAGVSLLLSAVAHQLRNERHGGEQQDKWQALHRLASAF